MASAKDEGNPQRMIVSGVKLMYVIGMVPSARDSDSPQWMKGSEIGRKLIRTKKLRDAIRGREVPWEDGCTIGENPLSMDGRFNGRMETPAMDKRTFEEISLKELWRRVQGMGYFPRRMFPSGGFRQQIAATVADKPRR